MADHYHDPSDTKRFKDLRALAPKEFEAWVALDRIVGRKDGQIPALRAGGAAAHGTLALKLYDESPA